MKKRIITLTFILLGLQLSGCATTQVNKLEGQTIPSPLVTASFQEEMTNIDNNKLLQLISTAKPQQVEKWENHEKHRIYEFTSLKIYLDEQGRPCRIYQLHTSTLWRDYRMEGNACRVNDGSWQGSSKEIK